MLSIKKEKKMRHTKGIILGAAALFLAGAAYTVLTIHKEKEEASRPSTYTYTKKSETEEKKREITVTPVSVDNEITTKQEAVYRMINAIDYYHSIDVQFTYVVKTGESAKSIHLSAVNMPDNHLTQIETNTDESGQDIVLYENGSIYSEKYSQINHNPSQTHQSKSASDPENSQAMTLAESVTVEADGTKSYNARQDLNHFTTAKIVALPSELALRILEDPSLYELTGTELICGRNTIVIEGTFSGDNQTIYQGDYFKLNVDAKTGVLLGMSVTQNEQEKEYVKVESVAFDQVPAAFQ
ncbi:hypothetical protein D920_00977 [Enterococcus faecalis 13-SD-W-01]|nr:hypothetical protein D920_00977 [Enterococcus faecalis 13-SD-W-01]